MVFCNMILSVHSKVHEMESATFKTKNKKHSQRTKFSCSLGIYLFSTCKKAIKFQQLLGIIICVKSSNVFLILLNFRCCYIVCILIIFKIFLQDCRWLQRCFRKWISRPVWLKKYTSNSNDQWLWILLPAFIISNLCLNKSNEQYGSLISALGGCD